MAKWHDIPFNENLYQGADEALLSKAVATLENCYTNAAGGQSRFPGILPFVDGLGGTETYLHNWRNNLIAVTNRGRCFRIGKDKTVEDVTGIPLAGGGRTTFAQTEDELMMAAGGPILRLARDKTEILSDEAPNTTHVAYIDGYAIAIEIGSGRFRYSDVGQYRTWPPLNIYSAEAKPDDLNSCVVTPYRELLMGGVDSIEQYERLPSGTQPFFRRWTTGEGVAYPYTMVGTKVGTFAVNSLGEFVRFIQQSSEPDSEDVGLRLDEIQNWDRAWVSELISIKGMNFVLLQIPEAESVYGAKGVTLCYDYRDKRWSFLFGWDDIEGLPKIWPGTSVHTLWGDTFVGVPGGVGVLDQKHYENNGEIQRVLARSGHVDEWGASRIDDFKIRIKRGVGDYVKSPQIAIRVNRDNRGFSQWQYKGLGLAGDRQMVVHFGGQGIGDTFQWEYFVTDPAAFEFVGAMAYVEPLTR